MLIYTYTCTHRICACMGMPVCMPRRPPPHLPPRRPLTKLPRSLAPTAGPASDIRLVIITSGDVRTALSDTECVQIVACTVTRTALCLRDMTRGWLHKPRTRGTDSPESLLSRPAKPFRWRTNKCNRTASKFLRWTEASVLPIFSIIFSRFIDVVNLLLSFCNSSCRLCCPPSSLVYWSILEINSCAIYYL